jgi:hypothetical protein
MGNVLGNQSLNVVSLVTRVEAAASNLTEVRSIIVSASANNVTGFPSPSSVPEIGQDTLTQITTARTQVQQSSQQIQDTVTTLKASVNVAQGALLDTLRAASSAISQALNGVTSALNSAVSALASVNTSIGPIMATVRTYQVYRCVFVTLCCMSARFGTDMARCGSDYAMWGLLGVPVLLWVLGMMGGLLQNCSTCFSQWCSCWYDLVEELYE